MEFNPLLRNSMFNFEWSPFLFLISGSIFSLNSLSIFSLNSFTLYDLSDKHFISVTGKFQIFLDYLSVRESNTFFPRKICNILSTKIIHSLMLIRKNFKLLLEFPKITFVWDRNSKANL